MRYESGVCRSRVKSLLVVLAMLLGMGSARSALGQIDQGAVTGIITDASGNSIRGAAVLLVNQETNLSFSRTTGGNGYYTFSPIKIGVYTLTVTAPSFETIKQENIRVNVSQTIGLNLSLKPGSVNDTITVTSTPEIQTEDASTGQVFSSQAINDTP